MTRSRKSAKVHIGEGIVKPERDDLLDGGDQCQDVHERRNRRAHLHQREWHDDQTRREKGHPGARWPGDGRRDAWAKRSYDQRGHQSPEYAWAVETEGAEDEDREVAQRPQQYDGAERRFAGGEVVAPAAKPPADRDDRDREDPQSNGPARSGLRRYRNGVRPQGTRAALRRPGLDRELDRPL